MFWWWMHLLLAYMLEKLHPPLSCTQSHLQSRCSAVATELHAVSAMCLPVAPEITLAYLLWLSLVDRGWTC